MLVIKKIRAMRSLQSSGFANFRVLLNQAQRLETFAHSGLFTFLHHRGTEEDEIAQRKFFSSVQSHPPPCLCGEEM